MADLRGAHRDRLARAAALDEQRAAIVAGTAALERLRRERAQAAAGRDPRDPATRARLQDLDERIAEATKSLDGRRDGLRLANENLREAIEAFGELADPTSEVGKLDADTPLLLMPVRIETRFTPKELWVRVYPDQWAVDSFEPMLSESEIANGRVFWGSMFRAGGDDGMRRSAWRALVASHGSGRSAWIIEQFRPVDPSAEPVRAGPDEVILVVTTDEASTAGERAALAAYWEGVWRAGGDAGGGLRTALDTAVGVGRAGAIVAFAPATIGERPATIDPATAVVTVAFCQLPATPATDTATSSWTAAARVHVLPDRFVLLGYVGGAEVMREFGNPIPPSLSVGPDPAAGPSEQFRIENGDLVVPDDLRWMVDFDEAVKVGMGMRVALDRATLHGFDRLFVVGLRVGATPDEDQAEFETLLTHHHRSRAGMSILAQGTPTNNTEGLASGLDRLDDSDASYDHLLAGSAGLVDTPEWADKQDGQWLAECLGIDATVFAGVAGATGRDQAEARAANTALWPATWGYFLDSMLHPIVSDATAERVRSFFIDYVSGRGRVPALRIGRQPYGILPATSLGALRFAPPRSVPPRPVPVRPDSQTRLLDALHRITSRIATDWAALADAAPHVPAAANPQQTLLDVVALHPASVEFHQRYAESIEDLFNRFNLDNLGREFFDVWQAFGSILAGRQLLADLGYGGQQSPDILDKLFNGRQQRLKGPVVDDRPLSEQLAIRAYCDDGRNYLQWLFDAATTSLETLRREDGFTDDEQPTALLYLLLRHALLLSWWDAGTRLRLEAGIIDRNAFDDARKEPAFIHVAGDGPTESRWRTLYDGAAVLTGDDRTPLHEVILGFLDRPATKHLAEIIDSIKRIADLPTARLERLLAEHLDLCSHRVDAWRLGLVTHRLLALRGVAPADGLDGGPRRNVRRGVHLGAYGWLEDVRPEAKRLERAELSDELAKVFLRAEDAPLARDQTNGGFVHAPSLNHATTAAILRSGFMANATPAHPDAMALNISSERMRLAVSVLQGLRNGQTLGALLGYRFERGLHDRHGLAEIDSFIHPLRKEFPSPGDRDGRLVIDGLDFVRHIQTTGIRTYPFGRPGLPAATAAKQAAIDAEVERLLDVHDAIADLVLAEGVHQAVLGNFDRVAATLDTVGRGGFPTEPAVLETPTSGITLTHRFAIHLRTGLDHTAPVGGVDPTPRSLAEPGVNEFVAAMLPPPADVVVKVTWIDSAGGDHARIVTQAELGLQPIDLLAMLRLESEAALGELDERIVWLVTRAENLRPDEQPSVRLTERVAGRTTLFELAPLIGHLRSLLTRSRPLRASDAGRANDVSADDDALVHADRARPAAVAAALDVHRTMLATLAGDIDTLVAGPVVDEATIRRDIDVLVRRVADATADSGRFGLAASGWGDLGQRREALFTAILATAGRVVTLWRARLAEAERLLALDDAWPSTATAAERIAGLILADRELRAAPTSPVPTDDVAYRTAIDAQRIAFAAKLAGFESVAAASDTLHEALANLAGLLPITDFDAAPVDIAEHVAGLVALCVHMSARLHALIALVDERRAAGAARLTDHDAAAGGRAKVDALVAATQALLGPDALFVPEFDLSSSAGDQWAAAMAWSRSGDLTSHLSPGREFPVDDWLLGVARVRDKIRDFEQVRVLATGFGRSEPDLWPIQLPHGAEPWLGLEWPDAFTLSGERVLYTAHYPAAFDKSAAHAGLLIDEWVELIPNDSATTGVVFHYDAPDTEPPQAMLLVVPPDPAAGWRWDDVVQSMHDTLALARLRAVEPDRVAETRYAAFLPATVSEATLRGLAISVNFALNNHLFKALRVDHA